MKKQTRFAFNAYLSQLARIYSVEIAELSSKFSVEPHAGRRGGTTPRGAHPL